MAGRRRAADAPTGTDAARTRAEAWRHQLAWASYVVAAAEAERARRIAANDELDWANQSGDENGAKVWAAGRPRHCQRRRIREGSARDTRHALVRRLIEQEERGLRGRVSLRGDSVPPLRWPSTSSTSGTCPGTVPHEIGRPTSSRRTTTSCARTRSWAVRVRFPCRSSRRTYKLVRIPTRRARPKGRNGRTRNRKLKRVPSRSGRDGCGTRAASRRRGRALAGSQDGWPGSTKRKSLINQRRSS